MLKDITYLSLSRVYDFFAVGPWRSLLLIPLAGVGALLLWRLWTFTISPILHPNEPREFPYWTPFLGHALGFFKDQDGTLTRGREYFMNTREPFSITLAGEKLYILSSAHDVTTAFRNNTTLTYDLVIRDLLGAFGVSDAGVDLLYQAPTVEKPVFQPRGAVRLPQDKSVGHLKGDFYHYQLYPGKEFDVIQDRFLKLINEAMQSRNFTNQFVISTSVHRMKLSLLKWCQHVIVRAGTTAFFGPTLLERHPSIFQDFVDFDDHNWMVWYKWPDASLMQTPKTRVLRTLEEYLRIPKEQRVGVAWIIDAMEDSQRNLGMSESDIACVIMTLLWVINTNTYKVAFWMLSYMLFSEDLYEQIRQETKGAMLSNGTIDLPRLMGESRYMDSLWNEVLRMTNSSSAVRTVMQPTRIGNKVLQPGHKVMSPFRQLHFDENIFGCNANECDPYRFLKKESLAKDQSYRPFGGGATFCPGRFIARQEVFIFIALAVHRFDVSMASASDSHGNQKFPRLETQKPTTGVMSSQVGEDLVIMVKEYTEV